MLKGGADVRDHAKRSVALATLLLTMFSTDLFGTSQAASSQQGNDDISKQVLKESGRIVKSRARALKPTNASEVEFDEFILVTDEHGRRKLVFSKPQTPGKHTSVFYVADPSTERYAALDLSGDHLKDAKRIKTIYADFGLSDVSESGIAHQLLMNSIVDSQRMQHQLARPVSASKDSPTIKPAIAYPDSRTERQNPCSSSVRVTRIQWIANCYGSAYANVQTWDPAGFVFDAGVLNETWSYADWIRSDGWITSLNPVGNCWADDETFLYTHWFVTGCSGLQYNGGWSFSYSKYGEYFNEDFVPLVSGGELEGAVLISHRATVGSDGPNEPFIDYEYTENSYSAGWFALGLITGHFSGDTAEANNCWFVCSPSESDVHDCEYEMLGYWNYDLCECSHGYDPLIIDMADDGFAFTDANNGVTFDLRADGHPIQTAWTQPGSTDAFLVLDRNGNGTVDDGSELFSDVSPQNAAGANVKLKKKSSGPNGFGALSVFDTVAAGGNADGQISSDDSVFGALRLWTDENHNGVSEAPELKSLDSQGVRAISLKYSASKQNDQYGNHVAYRSRAIMDRDMVSARGTSLRVANVFFLGH